MQSKSELLRDQLKTLGADVKDLVATLTTDPKAQARKERRWTVLYGALSAVFTLVTRKAAARSWGVLTGEQPPNRRTPPAARTGR